MEKTKTNESTSKRNLPTEPRLLSESAEQQELAETMQELIKTIKELAETLKVLEQHEYLELHRSKWKLVAYNILLWILFAFGTVFGLVLLSWLTFNFFKDSAILNGIVDNQLKIRQIDIGRMKETIKNDLKQDLGQKVIVPPEQTNTGK